MAATADQDRLRIVIDPDDDLDTLRAVRALHARPFGQIVCEVEPTTSAGTLAEYLLDALGKTSAAAHRKPWPRARALLSAEHIEHLVVMRAQLLTYPGLHRLCDCTTTTRTRLWLLAAGELPGHAITQLLERRPHQRLDLEALLAELSIPDRHEHADLPASEGLQFPWLKCPDRPVRRRADLARGLRGGPRASVLNAYDRAHAWITAWDHEHPDGTQQHAADAAYELCSAAATASEITIRAHAALHALATDGWNTRTAVFDELAHYRWGELRPGEYTASVARAAQIADACADPFDACLIALSALTRCRYTLRTLRVGDVTDDGAVIAPRGFPMAVPPALRAPLVAQRLVAESLGPRAPLLQGPTRGRPNKITMRSCYDRHGVPDSLRADGTRSDADDPGIDIDYGLDGRDVLTRLNAYSLFEH